MNIGDSFRNVMDTVINFLPNLAVFLVILVVGWIVAKVLRKVVNMVLERVHFDRAVERGGIQRALARSKYDASGLIAAIVYYAVLLMALQMGFAVFGPNPVSNLLSDLVAWMPMAVVAIVIIVVAAAIANAVKDIVSSALGGFSWGNLVARVAQGFIIALAVIAALNQMGVATTVTTPVLVAVLATVGGILVVGVGGGMVRPMQQRWEQWLGRAEAEMPGNGGAQQAYQRGREDTMRARSGEPAAGAAADPDPQTGPIPTAPGGASGMQSEQPRPDAGDYPR
ncbi:hypothetical protein BJF85_09610 [Saccharomonospora sp. CUA-673]|uniref:mechanosensitive ion channel family protein n=1 Tax=Saccharomonospora sp. CUA-673 TaxID=1904969 RepID=UPI0009638B8A|nr:hypothetical protein [Saccharomonospora sp. CUA-673]OLT38545.1 hypothetical protein BJF85_09610 [Saccharomonospora sp. CUA-673]